MAYTINTKNSSVTSIAEGGLDDQTMLDLVGKDTFSYGQAVAQSFVDLLQNFASTTDPKTRTTAEGFTILEGQLWWDATSGTLKVMAGGDYPGTGDWVTFDPTIDETANITATDGTVYTVKVARQNNIPVAITSSQAFDVNTTIHGPTAAPINQYSDLFPRVERGITLATDSTPFKFHGTATSAQYADLAEMYASDKEYNPGTVVMLGGSAEVTECDKENCENIFGVVSTDPAYLMNSAMEGTTVAVALAGRVPCRVIGKVEKGQRLVSAQEPGAAKAASEYATYQQVLGRALENKDTNEEGIIEVVVGVK